MRAQATIARKRDCGLYLLKLIPVQVYLKAVLAAMPVWSGFLSAEVVGQSN